MATIETLYDLKCDLAVHKIEGVLTAEEAIRKIEEYYEGAITKNTLWDLTNAEVSQIASSEIQGIVDVVGKFAHLRNGGRAALVIPEDLGYGLGRMLETFSEIDNIPYPIRCFRGIDEAMEWLNV